MGRAGFARRRAADVWEQLVAEMAAVPDAPRRDLFTATHPDPSERVRTLRELAGDGGDGETAPERLRAVLASLRSALLQDEVRLHQPARSLVVFGHLRDAFPEDAELAFYTGEVHRQRDAEGDVAAARAAYERALALPRPPVETWRSLGLVARRAGDAAAANAAFRRYLELAPAASDRRIIQSYLTPEG